MLSLLVLWVEAAGAESVAKGGAEMDGITLEKVEEVSVEEAGKFLDRFLATHHTQDVTNPNAKKRVQVSVAGVVGILLLQVIEIGSCIDRWY